MPAVGARLLGDASTGAAYDVVLLAHVLFAIVALIAVIVAGVSAVSLSRPGPVPERVARYYRPGINWAGRSLVAVPVLGFALVGMSRGEWAVTDDWVVAGLVLWVVAAALAEAVLWPTERRLQGLVRHSVTHAEAEGASGSRVGGDDGPDSAADGGEALRSLCRRTQGTAASVAVILVAATVVMVAKP
ncbi:MAG: hypothetical protein JO368_02080 [Acidimicrobiales bacterium]|nr:hypothetical protein [Acidimicrobiales bacterium]